MRLLSTVVAGTVMSTAALLPSTALADHFGVSIEAMSSPCAPVTIATRWLGEDSPYEEEARLVVLTQDGVETAPVGESLNVGPEDMSVPPTSTRSGEVYYRVWVGHEHYYGNPAPYDKEALLVYLDEGGSPLAADVPGVPWSVASAGPCSEYEDPPTPEPSPSLPDRGPSPEPTPSYPGTDPSVEPEPTPAPDPTGEPVGWLSDLPSAPEGMKPGQWCDTEDRLVTLYAYTDTSALQCQDDNGWRWVEVHSPEELIVPPSGDPTATPTDSPSPTRSPDPSPAQAAPPAEDPSKRLPVTGASLTALVLVAVVAVTGGLAALWAARGRAGGTETV
ncbi:hypothetical protein [Nocardiopsis synnemataformans]|uniref:hypothetical protein n=1 Tax=Nocardiopsis synnemataformans TaxID=61305 RepID=UPI003EBD2B85